MTEIPEDKRKHFIYGFLLSILGVFWFPLLSLGFIAGVVKELLDLFGYGCPEWLDLWYTWAGAVLAVFVVICIWFILGRSVPTVF